MFNMRERYHAQVPIYMITHDVSQTLFIKQHYSSASIVESRFIHDESSIVNKEKVLLRWRTCGSSHVELPWA